ncbi:MAG: sigma 54-interacting transcriptional regulator [Deltaproteobacteria bacterium]|nr:sigma 54-interacting transcriptional regulator [Deltaproteobacteria bacterium]
MVKFGLKEELSVLEVIDSMPWSVTIYDAQGKVLFVNRKLCENINANLEDFVGKSADQLVEGGYIDKVIVTQAIQKRKTVYGITRSRTGVEGLSVCQPVVNDQGVIKFFVVSSPLMKDFQDIRATIEDQQAREKIYIREIEYLRNLLFLDQEDVFESSSMKTILQTVYKISHMDCTVLITGESGTGKEVVAKIIHKNSNRKDGPFIPVNISAIPETLLESELYGYKEGAFTGALRGGKAGLFEVAEGGTLFVDEVGDIPIGIQVKILRAIDSGEITRVGDTRARKMNVRIIAATNRNLEEDIKNGRFRDDLYYRLNVVPIKISPLRERPEDIWLLALHFLKGINEKYKMNKSFSPEILAALKTYHWPGNIRELRNVIERLAILSNKDEIFPDDFNNLIGIPSAINQPSATALHEYDAYEQSRILSALKEANGNKSKAAKILSMPRSTLYRKLHR